MVFLFFFPTVGKTELPFVTPHNLVPEREVIFDSGQDVPKWKMIWDKARRLTKAGDYQGAIAQYGFLLSQKKNIDEVQWELARLYIHLQRWDEAAVFLEPLVEANPRQVAYLNGLGRVMWEKEQFDRATDLFRRAYAQDHDDPTALAGLVEGLVKLGNKEEALPFLEQLHLLQPDNLGVHRYLALMTYELAYYEKARLLLIDLAEKENVDLEILQRTAQVHEKLGLSNVAVKYWKRILSRRPDSPEAHSSLADFFESSGRIKEALPHMLAIVKSEADNADLLARIGLDYEKTGQQDKALTFYQRYLRYNPNNPEVLRSIVKIYAAQGNKEKTLAALEQYFKIKTVSEPEDLKLAAQLYDASGRFHKAIPLYRQLIDITPGDSEILESLADDLLAIGENEGALSMWKHLTKVTSKPLPIYHSMADLLERLHRDDELLEVLKAIHEMDQADQQTTLKLAILYLDKKDMENSQALFEELDKAGFQNAEFLLGLGSLLEKTDRPEAALKTYETLLNNYPEQRDIHLRCAHLAGVLGRTSLAIDHLKRFSSAAPETEITGSEQVQLQFEKGRIFQVAGFFRAAVTEFDTLLADLKKEGSDRARTYMKQVWLAMAETYKEANLYFEAEQVLREALSTGDDRRFFVRALLKLALVAENLEDGEVWLTELKRSSSFDRPTGMKSEEERWQISLLEVRLLVSQGEYRAAIKLCRSLLERFSSGTRSAERKKYANENRLKISLVLARIFLDTGKLTEAEKLVNDLLGEGWKDLELFVLLQQIYLQVGDWTTAQDVSRTMVELLWNGDINNADLGDLMRLATSYGSYNNAQGKYDFALAAYRRAPDSLRAQFLLIEAAEDLGKLKEALELLLKINKSFPDNTKATVKAARLLFRTGQFEEALAKCDSVLTSRPKQPDVLLLKARILWAKHRWKESSSIYQTFLDPSVSELLASQLRDRGLMVDLIPETSFWQVITFSGDNMPDLAELVMSPSYVLNTSKENSAVSLLAAPLYAQYKWQVRFASELRARRSVQRREYSQAADLYETLIEQHANEESLLFDLAGTYSRLGRLGDEAALYDRLQILNPEFPGLADAIQRNKLKRRPSISMGYGYLLEDGRNNYKAIEKKWGEINVSYSPRSQHRLDFNASRIRYKAVHGDNDLWSKRFFLSYNFKLKSGLSALMGVGVESLDDEFSNSGIFSFSLLGKIGDKLKSRLTLSRDLTADTLASLTRNITHDDIEAGFAVDFFPRLSLGSDFGYVDFSDNNQKNEYALWSTYILFFEPTLLKLNYSYEFDHFRENANPGLPLADGFALNDHPYYAPNEYWLSKISLFFKHQLSDDTLDRGIPRYYTIEYTIGYDSEDEDLQAFESSFLMELNEHFIMKASASVNTLKSFKRKDLFLSAIYRW